MLETVPMNPSERNEENTDALKLYLVRHNMFFAKIEDVLANCLLKLNRVVYVRKN